MAPTLLKLYVTPVGTDEATPRTITFDTPSTPLRTIVAIVPCSQQVNVSSPWAVLDGDISGTACHVFYLPGASNSGATSITITQAGPAYPFSMLVFEDDIGTFGPLSGPGQVMPASTWDNINTFFSGTYLRTVAYWNALRYQNPPVGDISAYSNGLTELGDTGVSSTFNSSHVEWYSCRTWAAWVDGLTGTILLNATCSSPSASTGWTGNVQYTVVLPAVHLTVPTASASVAAYPPSLSITLPTLTIPNAAVGVVAQPVTASVVSPIPTTPSTLEPGTCRTLYGIDFRFQLAIGRQEGVGYWDEGYWDNAVWGQTDSELGDWVNVGHRVEVPFKLQAGTTKADGIVTRWEAATCYFTLWGNEWDPWDGPYKNIVGPGVGVRVLWRKTIAFDTDPWFYAFRGSVAADGWDWTPGPKHDFVNVAATDLTETLVAYEAVAGDLVGDGDLASQRVGRILDVAEWPNDSAHRDITSGGITNQKTNLGGVAWEQLLITADTDLGLLWVNRAGVLTYRPTARTGENIRHTDWRFVVCEDH